MNALEYVQKSVAVLEYSIEVNSERERRQRSHPRVDSLE
jgi:hypothetical protein